MNGDKNMLPQIIFLVLISLDMGIAIAKHKQPKNNYNIWDSLIGQLIILLLLYWGGFFNVFFK